MVCAGEFVVSVDKSYIGYGATKDDALQDLLDRIAAGDPNSLRCHEESCDDGHDCVPSVDLEDVENGRIVRYGRAGGRWKSFLFGRNQGTANAQIPVYCSCVPALEEDGDASFKTIAVAPKSVAVRPVKAMRAGSAKLDIDDHILGERCVDGLVGGTARNIAPVTDPDKTAAEQAVLTAARAAALADAQLRCDAGSCTDTDDVCTFVKILEGSSISTTPSRDPRGNIVWTCRLVSFEVIGVCICKASDGEKEKPRRQRKK